MKQWETMEVFLSKLIWFSKLEKVDFSEAVEPFYIFTSTHHSILVANLPHGEVSQ